MDMIRAVATGHAHPARLVVILVAGVALFAGLLAMHATGGQHASQSIAHGTVALQFDGDATADSARSSGIGDTHCAINCDDPLNAPSHSLLTACVLALLILLLLLAPPGRRSLRHATRLMRRRSSRPAERPRMAAPLSLPMLSVSRT
jgi:hypothetical protein